MNGYLLHNDLCLSLISSRKYNSFGFRCSFALVFFVRVVSNTEGTNVAPKIVLDELLTAGGEAAEAEELVAAAK